jgi:hypothetical protein
MIFFSRSIHLSLNSVLYLEMWVALQGVAYDIAIFKQTIA